MKKQIILIKLYKQLYQYFGPQHWWPTFNKKGDDRRFEICVGAILTQNTSWINVEKALKNLRAAGLMSPEAMFKAPFGKIQKAIKPAGYFNQKTKKLKLFLKFLRSYGLGDWKKSFQKLQTLSILELRKTLLGVWGIGRETADSIILYAFQKPVFVIDVYTKRLLNELGVKFKNYDEYREFFESQLPRQAKMWNEYHALIVAWGKLFAKNAKQAQEIIK